MQLLNKLAGMIKRNQTTLLSSAAISGVVTTAYLAARGAIEAKDVIKDHEFDDAEKLPLKDQTLLVWKFYIPAAASGVVTILCIVGVAKVGNKRAMAAQAAFVLTERAYSEYRDKVIEEVGEKREEKIRASLAQDRVHSNQPPSVEVLVTGPGNILCYEEFTGRYFASDIETLRKKQNDLNSQLLLQDTVSMSEWYYMIKLPPTTYSDDLGWTSDKLMELKFSSVLTDDGRPCLSFSYNYHRPLFDGLYR